jgi:hypothetical protein
MAERLPVAAIPEKNHVAFVRDDVVNLSRCYDFAGSIVLSTERVLNQETFACLLPLVVVAALGAGLTLPFAALGLGALADVYMIIAVARVAGQHIATLGIAWFLRPQGHTLPTSNHLAADCQPSHEHQDNQHWPKARIT